MTFDGSAEADIRGLNIDKLVKGFGEIANTFKQYVQVTKTSAREIRWFQKGLTTATAMNKLDTPTTQGVTTTRISNTSFKARPFVTEQKWQRNTSYIKKYFVESPLISMEDIKDNDIDVLAGNIRDLVDAVGRKIDLAIYDCLTEGTNGTPNPTTVNDTAATAGWSVVATADPILDLLNAKQEIQVAGYNPEGAVCLMNPIEYKELLSFLINVKGSSIPSFSSAAVKNGVVMELLGLKIAVSQNATTTYVVTFVPKRAATWKSFMPLTSATIDEPGIGKKFRVWEEGVAILTDPLAVHVLTGV